jgi:hypothetical protein
MVRVMAIGDSTHGVRPTVSLRVAAAAGVVRTAGVVRSLVPARLDRLPWSPFHCDVVTPITGAGRGGQLKGKP